jgi:hypothetical protein
MFAGIKKASAISRMHIDSALFYAQYRGHPLADVAALHQAARERGDTCVFLAGDSSIDNKHWLYPAGKVGDRVLLDPSFTGPAPPQYQGLLDPPRAVKDVAYWMNRIAADAGTRVTVLNLAVEESTLRDRKNGLLPHDCFIRDHLQPHDVLVVSIGGNDVVLKPTAGTIAAAASLLALPTTLIDLGLAPGFHHFQQMFKGEVTSYAQKLVEKCLPKAVLPCMIYFPDKRSGSGGWADSELRMMGYDLFPGKLQQIIQKLYAAATMNIRLSGTQVIPVPLFAVLDGNETTDYVQRMEPSVSGGLKIARLLSEHLNVLV